MPELNLDELEKLAAQATPGPWEQGDGVFDPSLIRTSYKVGSNIIGDIIHRKALRRDTKGRVYVIEVCGEQWRENAAYIVAACNAAPELIAENRALKEKVRELERQKRVLVEKMAIDILCSECPVSEACPYENATFIDLEDCAKQLEKWSENAAKEAGEDAAIVG